MIEAYRRILEQSDARRENLKRYFERLKRKKPRELDQLVSELHDEVFAEIDCLACGNCCSTISPRFNDRDVNRLSRLLGQKKNGFIRQYLAEDADGDLVLQTLPCPFLQEGNHCFVYPERPLDCQNYPHTHENVHAILNKTLLNTEVCPAVWLIFERLQKRLPM